MIFLIEYNRPEGRLVSIREFDSAHRQEASSARLQLELDRHQQGIKHEIVLLEAENQEALRRTHQRYFASLRELLIAAGGRDERNKKPQ